MFNRAFPPLMADMTDKQRWHSVGEWIGFTGLTLFCFFSLLSISGANLGLALMLLGLVFSPQAWRQLPRQPLFWAAILSIVYVFISRFVSPIGAIGDADVQNDQAKDWAMLFLFPVTAWWISRHPNRQLYSLGLMFAGFAAGILTSLYSGSASTLLGGMRSGMHFGKAIIFGFDCAVAILAMMIMIVYWLDPRLELSWPQRVVRVGIVLLVLLFFSQGLVVSQSRGVWLAMLLTLPVMFSILWYGMKDTYVMKRKAKVLVFLSVFSIVALALLANWKVITERLVYENMAFGVVVSEGLEKAPLSSSTYRLHLWRFGLEKWLEEPVTGWGPGTTYSLVEVENVQELKNPNGKGFDHLHNAYLELLMQLGLIGLFFTLWNAILMISGIVKGYRHKALSVYMFSFLVSNFVLISVYSLTDFRHLHWNWRFYWLVLAGIIFVQCMALTRKGGAGGAQAEPHKSGR
jgi:hypothetical protein